MDARGTFRPVGLISRLYPRLHPHVTANAAARSDWIQEGSGSERGPEASCCERGGPSGEESRSLAPAPLCSQTPQLRTLEFHSLGGVFSTAGAKNEISTEENVDELPANVKHLILCAQTSGRNNCNKTFFFFKKRPDKPSSVRMRAECFGWLHQVISISPRRGCINSGGSSRKLIYEALPDCFLPSMQPQCKHPDTARADYK